MHDLQTSKPLRLFGGKRRDWAAQKRERNRMVGMTGSKTTLRRVECSAAVEVEGFAQYEA